MENKAYERERRYGIILSYVHTLLNIVIQLVYTPVMIRLLGQGEYGIYTVVGSVVGYLSLFTLGFNGAYLRFHAKYQTDEAKSRRLNGLFVILFMCMGAMALVCGLILCQFPKQIFGGQLAADQLMLAQKLMYFMIIAIVVAIVDVPLYAMITSRERFIFLRVLDLAALIVSPFICLPLLLMGYGSIVLVAVSMTLAIVRLLVDAWFCVFRLQIPFEFTKVDWSVLKEISVFSSFIFLNMLVDQINWNVDKLILSHTTGAVAVAIYGVAGQLNSLYMTFSTVISNVFAPHINQIAVKTKEHVEKEYTRWMIMVGRVQLMVLGIVLLGFVTFGRYFLVEIYVGQEYADSYVVALLLIAPATIPFIQSLGIEIQRAMNLHQFRSVIYFIMALVNMAISIPMAKHWGAPGAAMGTTLGILLANGLIMNLFYHFKMKLDMVAFWKEMLQVARGFLPSIAMTLLFLRVCPPATALSFCIEAAIYSLVYFVSIWLFSAKPAEKELLLEALHLKR